MEVLKMENIIETLYTYLTRPQTSDLELKKVEEEYLKMSSLLNEQYGPDFMDRFNALQEQIREHNSKREFYLGFHSCARLFLEALSDQV